MAFEGYLLKVGNFAITGRKVMVESSYKATRLIQDLDSYRDANGVLHRNALPHQTMKVEFNTRRGMTDSELATFLGNIQSQFTVPAERRASVKVFIPEINDYITQDMYMPDPEIVITHIYNDVVYYDSIRIAFIGY